MKNSIRFLAVLVMICLTFTGCVAAENQAVDVDLTALSSTMRAAEMYNMQIQSENYVGKTIKISGNYATSYSEEMKAQYHFVLVPDASGCCEQGMEFIWNGEHAFPADYPEVGQAIAVIGVYGVYEEAGNSFYYVAVEDITVL